MPAGIRFDADTAPLRRRVGRMAAALERPERMFDEIGALVAASVVDRFERGRGPDGRRWTPSRRAVEQGGRTLVDRARLRDSVTHVARRDGVDIGTNVVYAAVHQFGSGDLARPKGIPARPFLGLDDEDERGILEILRRGLAA